MLLLVNVQRVLVGCSIACWIAGLVAGGGIVTAVGLILGMLLLLVAVLREDRRRTGAWLGFGGSPPLGDVSGDGGHSHGHHAHGGDASGAWVGGHTGGGHHGGGHGAG